MTQRELFRRLNQIPISVQIGQHTADMLWWGVFEDGWWRNYLHVHSFFEVCYAFQGRGTFYINTATHPIQPGDLFIARPNDYHEIVASEEDPLGIFFWAYTLVPDKGKDPESSISDLLNTFMHTQACVSQQTQTIQPVIDLMIDEISRQQAGYIQSLEALLVKLLLETARSVTDVPGEPQPEADSTVMREVLHYLKDNYHQPILIRDVAAQVHMSERHLSRLFQQATGKTIKTYLTDLRLQMASRLLLRGQLSVTEVAQAVGYGDVRHFITLFRKRKGLTPTAFQAQNGTRHLQG